MEGLSLDTIRPSKSSEEALRVDLYHIHKHHEYHKHDDYAGASRQEGE